MNQRVKLQVTSDLIDVPRLTGIILQEAVIDTANLHQLLEQISNHLKHIELSDEQSLDALKVQINNMDGIRVLLSKIDSRVADVASVVGGLHEVLTKPQEQKVEENDSISSG
ncbi:MAG: hypothetical protein EBZ58_03035 [Bacteroidetes bacterium]|jgi:hypothetical protein|nr:hypothetical protein [Bacteroidota bacterium]